MSSFILVGYFLSAFGIAYAIGLSEISLPFRNVLAYLGYEISKRKPMLGIHTTLSIADPNQRAGVLPFLARWLLKLVECPACVGFHVGWMLSLFCYDWIPDMIFARGAFSARWEAAFAAGLATMATNLLIARFAKL